MIETESWETRWDTKDNFGWPVLQVEAPESNPDGSPRMFKVFQIWRQEGSEGANGYLAFRVLGDKAYIFHWEDGMSEWKWSIHDSAQLLWGSPDWDSD